METILFVLIGAILFGLVRSTETILDIRQSRRESGHDPKTYLQKERKDPYGNTLELKTISRDDVYKAVYSAKIAAYKVQ